MANIVNLVRLPEKPRQHVPPQRSIWSEAAPSFGVDEDRPDVAVVRFRGAVARWVAGEVWHPQQQDRWLDARDSLERRVPYHSCREFARLLAKVADGLESVEPDALRSEVARLGQCIVSLMASNGKVD